MANPMVAKRYLMVHKRKFCFFAVFALFYREVLILLAFSTFFCLSIFGRFVLWPIKQGGYTSFDKMDFLL